MRRANVLVGLTVFALALRAQDTGASAPFPPPSIAEKWSLLETETVAPFTLGAGAFNAAVSQVTRSAPLYGRHPWPTAYPKRFGASIGDIVSQNFFGDFLLASAFHEDTRYRRRGSPHRLWRRIGYAISRAVVTRTDSGEADINWANVLGTGMSAALSNAYYPPASRTARVSATNWGTSVAGSGPCESHARVLAGFPPVDEKAPSRAPLNTQLPGQLENLHGEPSIDLGERRRKRIGGTEYSEALY